MKSARRFLWNEPETLQLRNPSRPHHEDADRWTDSSHLRSQPAGNPAAAHRDDLQKEIARQQEILTENTTGAAQDPKKAEAARKAIDAEQLRRTTTVNSSY